MEKEFLIPVSKKAVEYGFKVGKKVYCDKLNFPDKFRLGGSSELQADVSGFIAETVVAEFFKQPFPQLTKQKNDEYDLLLKDKRIDVKKVGYARHSRRARILLHKRQFQRKKNLIDIFLFCTFQGSFTQQQTMVMHPNKMTEKLSVYVPIGDENKLWLIGWIKSEDVEKNAKTFERKDKDGKVLSESYWLKEKDLKNVKELM